MIYLAIVTFYIEEVTLVLAKGQALLFCRTSFLGKHTIDRRSTSR